MSKKRELSPEHKAECAALKALWLSKKDRVGVTQQNIADLADISPAGVSHYLNGVNSLNLKIARIFANAIDVDVGDFSPRLKAELVEMSGSMMSSASAVAQGLLDTSTLRQDVQQLIDDIVSRSKTGELDQDNVRVLRDSVIQFTKRTRKRSDTGANKQLRDALKNDPDSAT